MTDQTSVQYGAKHGRGQRIITSAMYPEDARLYDLYCDKVERRQRLTDRSRRIYKTTAKQFLCWAYEYERGSCTQVTRDDVEDWTHLLAVGDPEHDPPLIAHSESSVVSTFKSASLFFKWLEDRLEDQKFHSPFNRAEKPSIVHKPKKPVASLEQLKVLRDTLEQKKDGSKGPLSPEEYRDLAICCVFYDTGMRASELINLEDANIDRTPAARVWIDGDHEGTKNHEERKVRLDATTLYFYRCYREAEGRMREPQYAFNGPRGRIALRTLHAIVKRAWARTGLPGVDKFSPHTFRHSLATHIVEKRQMTDRQLMDYFGWKSMAMVLNYTRNVAPDHAAQAAEEAQIGFSQVESAPRRRRRS